MKLSVPVAAVVLLVIAAGAVVQQSRFREAIEVRQRALVATEAQAIESGLAGHLSDAVLLSELVAPHVAGDSPDAELRERLADLFSDLSAAKRVYDQVRFLDPEGMEVGRVNWTAAGPVAVPREQLQDKSSRPYFVKGIRTRGEVYVSELDLNMERGRVEEPHKPMVRLATRVAKQRKALALVTGESLGQVASQTLENLGVIEDSTDLTILRPLVGMDKSETVDLARRIGTFEISIKPHDDCCSLFLPPHPETRGKVPVIVKLEKELEQLADLENTAFDEREEAWRPVQ